MLKDSHAGYGLITILFHWVSALLIVFLFGLGIYMTGLDYYSPWYHTAPALHISLGLAVLLLMTLRLLWRSTSITPTAIPTIDAKLTFAANSVKVVIYLLVFVMGVTGYLITTAEGQPARFFDVAVLPATLELDASAIDLVGEVHEYSAWGLIIIAAIHGAAALFHHFIKHDRTLIRMLKPVKKTDQS